MKPEANEGSGMGELTPSFEGREVRTKKVASEHWFNAGDLAEAAGKRRDYAANWLRTAEASEYISLASSKLQNCNLVPEGGLVERIHGGDGGGGIWMHYKIARRFAQACSAELAWWVDETVEASQNGLPVEVPEHYVNQASLSLIGQAIADGIRSGFDTHMPPIYRRLDDHQESLNQHGEQLQYLSSQIERRREISAKTKRRHINAVAARGGRCPCCDINFVVTDGNVTGDAHFDHAERPTQPQVDKTWLICSECNMERRKTLAWSSQMPTFISYQQFRVRFECGRQKTFWKVGQ